MSTELMEQLVDNWDNGVQSYIKIIEVNTDYCIGSVRAEMDDVTGQIIYIIDTLHYGTYQSEYESDIDKFLKTFISDVELKLEMTIE